MAEKRFSELTTAGAMTGAELLAMSQETLGTLLSVKSTLQNIANWFAVNSQYASALDTSNKTLCGAINELKQLISLIPQFSIEVVNTLPVSDISETTIYLVPNSDPEQGNYYEEYIYVNNAWELVGTTEVDLSAYYTKLEVDVLLSAKANSSDVTTALALKEDKSSMNTDVTTIVVGLTDEQTTAAGNPVTLTTEQSGGAKSALVTFAPKQSGTGDPSPSNIRPFILWNGLNLLMTGKNMVNVADATISAQTTLLSGFNLKAGKYTLSANAVNNGTVAGRFRVQKTGTSNIYLNIDIPVWMNGQIKGTFTLLSDETVSLIGAGASAGYSFSLSNIQLEVGNIKNPTYEPYNGETHTATFPETIMGGSYDFSTGEGSGTWEYIAQYNGETITEPWISDRDVYAEGTTPSTGAEVCYKLATPAEITITPADVNLLKGSNTIWTDGDTVQIKYSELPQGNLGAVIDYIKKLEARVKALES